MKLSSTILQHHIFFSCPLSYIWLFVPFDIFESNFRFIYVLVAKLSLSADIPDAKRLQTQIAPQKRPKTSFEIRASSLYVFEICLSFETSLWRQRTSFNVLSNVAGFHDVINVINVQNIYKTVQ